jgi:hypothetical protein
MSKFQRRHYNVLAAEFRASRVEIDQHDIASDVHFWKVQQWEDMVCDFAGIFGQDNAGFNLERWYRATGYQRRPDGAMYVI